MHAALADTGPLYAAVDVDDQLHARAQHELTRLETEKRRVVVLFPTVLECYSLLVQRFWPQRAYVWLEDILAGADLINPLAADYHTAAAIVKRYSDQPLTLFDAVVAVVGARISVPIWTYDHHFDVLRAEIWRPT